MKNILAIFGTAAALVFFFSTFFFNLKAEPSELNLKAEPSEASEAAEAEPSEKFFVSLAFVGDLMLDRGVARSVENNFNGDFSALFAHLPFLKNYDILFGNLEGPISDRGRNVGSKWSFRMKPEVATVLAQAGFDIFSLANNHIADWSHEAFFDTLDHLKRAGVAFAGTSREPTIIEKNGIKIGFLAFSDVGPAWFTEILHVDENYKQIIAAAAAAVDVLIVSFHWGEEYKTAANARQKQIGRGAIEAGAKIVIGHHPHVIQEIEVYKEGLIAYSLGNFIFDQHFSEATMQGLLLTLTLQKNPFSQKFEINQRMEQIIKLNKKYQPLGQEEIEEKTEKEVSLCPKGTDNQDFFLANVSKTFLDNHVPNDLVKVEGICLRAAAAAAFLQMKTAAAKEGLVLKPVSGFRDASWQNILYKNSNQLAGTAAAVAPPGYSEHQLGTAIDLTTPSLGTSISDAFAYTPEYLWLSKNAHEFGFVLSYPAEKEKLTGYKFEPWHWRYVGELAKEMKEKNLTPTEALINTNY